MISTTVDHVKSLGRKSFRSVGVEPGVAQDLVDCMEVATFVTPFIAGTGIKIISNTGHFVGAVRREVSAAARFTGHVVEDFVAIQSKGFKPAYAFARTEGRAFGRRSLSSGNLPKSETSWFFERVGRGAAPNNAPTAKSEAKLAGRAPAASEARAAVAEVVDVAALLQEPKMADHHIFPRQFKKFFEEKGISIDDHTISLVHDTSHLRGIHGNGFNNMPGKWNLKWKEFIESNPTANQKDVYQFAGKLLDEYNINNIVIHGYKK